MRKGGEERRLGEGADKDQRLGKGSPGEEEEEGVKTVSGVARGDLCE